MPNLPRVVPAMLMVLIISAFTAFAQAPAGAAASGVTIITSANSTRWRFSAIGPVGQTRLEVLDAAGRVLFDSGVVSGNVRDWFPKEGDLSDGMYRYVLTVRDLSGQPSVSRGIVVVENRLPFLNLGETNADHDRRPTNDGETIATTVTTHNGLRGQVTSTHGSLTLGTGNVFIGEERDHIWIMPEGRIGIETHEPEATLDVAGMIRTRDGIRFADGTVLTSAANSLGSRLDANGNPIPDGVAYAAETSNPHANGLRTTVTNSMIVGSPRGNAGIADTSLLAKVSAIAFASSTTQGGASTLGAGIGGSSLVFSDNLPFFVVRDSKANLIGNNLGGGAVLLSITPTGNVGIGTGGADPQARLHVAGDTLLAGNLLADGQVGIGTSSPGQKLSVAGTIESTSGGFKFPDGTIQATASSGGGGADVPVGTIVAYAGLISSVPSGWLICDGMPVSRAQFASLFAAIGNSWGNGDGSTTFNIPDLRGRFLRGVDKDGGGIPTGTPRDPDRDSRIPINPGGNSGNDVGSAQTGQVAPHTHGINDSGHTHVPPSSKQLLALPRVPGDQDVQVGPGSAVPIALIAGTASSVTGISVRASTGTETRPLNGYVFWIVKAN